MNKQVIETSEAPSPVGPYSQAVVANGILYISGQIAIEPSTGDLKIDGSIEEETHQVMKNIGAVLEQAGCTFADVIKCSVFVKDMNLYGRINAVYGEYFDHSTAPARELVEVANLPKFVNIEISTIAQIPNWTMPDSKRVLSCTQPTGNLHFGRYFGAVQNWVKLQSEYHCLYGIVDLHAITMPYQPLKLRNATWDLAFNLVACGIEPEHIFIQSLIPEHIELSWILNCMTGFGELGKMTQFKDKSQQVKESGSDAMISSGLYTYPVLQAADILIYRADFVPVGKDQEQHLELTRNLAGRFNHRMGREYFVLPEPLFTEIPKVMSTADPTRKMSASQGEKHNIDVFASPDRIRKQIRSAVTDTGDQSDHMSPGIQNLFNLLKAAGAQDAYNANLTAYESGQLRYGDFKSEVADVLITLSEPFRERKAEILSSKKEMKDRIRTASAATRQIAQETIREVKDLAGLLNARGR